MEEVAHGVAKLSTQYGEALLDSILGWRGVGDPDAASRRAAGTAYGALTAACLTTDAGRRYADLFRSINHLLKRLQALENRQVEERHGLLLCLAAVFDQVPSSLTLLEGDGMTVQDSALAESCLGKITALVDTLVKLSSRKAELIVEAASRLVMSLVPLVQAILLGTRDIQTSKDFFSTSGVPSPYLKIASKVEGSLSEHPVLWELMCTMRKALPTWLARNEAEAIAPASCAALAVLVFSYSQERDATLESWAEMVRTKPTSRSSSRGEGYFHALASSQPLARIQDGTDVVCETLLARWTSDDEIETRVAILQSLTRSQILKDKPLVFLNLLADGLDDYTTTARGDVGSLVRMQALKAVQTLWQNISASTGEGHWVAASIDALFYSTLRLSAEKLDRVRPEAQAALSLLMKDE